jgi:hypothetical protein
MRLAILAALCATLFATNADAQPRHRHHHRPVAINSELFGFFGLFDGPPAAHAAHRKRHRRTPSHGLRRVMAEGAGRAIGRRPRAWCGWQMRKWLGVANPAANLARWWAGFGRPAHGPKIGAIVVWRHHVGKITGRAKDGRWIVKSGNDGHRVRERPRSVAGAIAFRLPV